MDYHKVTKQKATCPLHTVFLKARYMGAVALFSFFSDFSLFKVLLLNITLCVISSEPY